ncbi:MAG TPA: hypothetical protein VHO69_03500 [Phototrophicaceae bacterium]|nr:hypothetical protein [Phototrophicaceae bacterium]
MIEPVVNVYQVGAVVLAVVQVEAIIDDDTLTQLATQAVVQQGRVFDRFLLRENNQWSAVTFARVRGPRSVVSQEGGVLRLFQAPIRDPITSEEVQRLIGQ